MYRIIILLALCFLPLLSSATAPNQKERILQYHTKVIINRNATIDVTETIKVFANGQQIKRGIFREIPTRYTSQMGDFINFDLKVLNISKNGQVEPYHIDKSKNGIKIYIGKPNEYLDSGVYTYQISYKVNYAIGYFEQYDELYWNVTGNAWDFDIEKASALVQLPPNAPLVQQAGFTGKKGEVLHNFDVKIEGNTIFYQTTRPLGRSEGLTFAVAWPKGHIYQPSKTEQFYKRLRDNTTFIYSVAFLLGITVFYLICWFNMGRDPKKGTIIPLYEPPKGYSPGMVHYIYNMGFKTIEMAFTAGLTNLAVKGFIKLESKMDEEFTAFRQKNADKEVGPGEQAIMHYLFLDRDKLTFHRANHVLIQEALTKFKKNIKKEALGVYFNTNVMYFVVAVVLTLVYMIGLGLMSGIMVGFMLLWIGGWTLGVCALLYKVYCEWRAFFKGKISKIFSAIFITLFSIPFIGAEIFGFSLLAMNLGWSTTILLGLMMVVHFLFFHWLKQPTIEGRKVMDQIEGFRLFLGVANKERIESFEGPEITPELFEAYLPYAIALGIENEWSKQFEQIVAKTSEDQISSRSYRPSWYSGSSGYLGPAAMSSAIGSSLASSISSASTSSTGSGGGSSGGGGGGGGGGGW